MIVLCFAFPLDKQYIINIPQDIVEVTKQVHHYGILLTLCLALGRERLLGLEVILTGLFAMMYFGYRVDSLFVNRVN